MKCRVTGLLQRAETRKRTNGTSYLETLDIPIGTIIDDPECFIHVLNGRATAADEECEARVSQVNPAAIAKRSQQYDLMDAGIHPEDAELFKAGKITGYRAEYDPLSEPPHMAYTTGPNWTEADAAAIDAACDDADGEDDEDGEDDGVQQEPVPSPAEVTEKPSKRKAKSKANQ